MNDSADIIDDFVRQEPTPTDDEQAAWREQAITLSTETARTVADLYGSAVAGHFDGATRREGQHLLAETLESIAKLEVVRETLIDQLAPLMSSGLEVVDGIGAFQRERKFSTSWDNDGVRTLLRKNILAAAIDPETGEVDRGAVETVDRTLELVMSLYSLSSPKVGGLTALGADVDEYRSRTAVGYKVKFTPMADSEEPI